MVFDAFVGARRAGNRRRISDVVATAQNAADPSSLAPVSEPGTVGSGIELATVLSFIDIAVDALAGAREEIDALNVYPVPDGDTGTNMYLTMAAARDAVRERAATGDADRPALFEAFTRGALLGARGNSGVILSEMLRAIMRRIAEAEWDERNGAVMVDALRKATEASYAAVGTPVEGTMLSVCRAASDAAATLLEGEPRVRSRDVLTTSAAAAREALARTPDQLKVLRDAGVVDAGGRGVVVILDAAETALTGKRPPRVEAGRRIPRPIRAEPGADLVDGGPAYEVMYLLDAPDDAIANLRGTLAGLGDSLVVVGGEGLWNVHVHVDDVGSAIEAGIEAGRPHRVRVTHFAEQIAAREPRQRVGRAIVAVAAGAGLAELFEDAGAVVVHGGPGDRPSTGMLLDAMVRSGAQEVVVLPNDNDSVRAAQVAASTAEKDHDMRVAVIPTTAQVEGLAALAVHEPGRTFDQDVLEMTATARHARQGAVTIASRQAITMAGPCEPGDVLGAIGGDFVVVGHDLTEVAEDVLGRLLGGGGEMVTLVSGADDADGSLAATCAAWLEEKHPTVDVVVYDGGQERYPLLVAVE